MSKNKHTDLDGLIDLDSRSLIKLGNSAVVSIPSADDLEECVSETTEIVTDGGERLGDGVKQQ